MHQFHAKVIAERTSVTSVSPDIGRTPSPLDQNCVVEADARCLACHQARRLVGSKSIIALLLRRVETGLSMINVTRRFAPDVRPRRNGEPRSAFQDRHRAHSFATVLHGVECLTSVAGHFQDSTIRLTGAVKEIVFSR